MNILFFEDSSKSLFGGGQKISSFILEIMNSTSANVYYCDFRKNEFLESKLDLTRNKSTILLYYRKNYLLATCINFIFTILNCLRLILLFLSQKQDIIYSTNKRSLFYAFFLNRIFDTPYLYHAHMVLQNKWYDPLLIYTVKKAKFCICVSEFVKNEFIKRGLGNTLLINNPLDNGIVLKKKKNLNDKKFSIAYFGTINNIKGVNYLLDSVKYLNDIDFAISVYGEGDELEKLKSNFSFVNNIIFHGFINDVVGKLDDVDILILPSIIPEAAPTIIQQAMSRGVPVITTNLGGQQCFIKDKINGILVDPKSSKQIADAILIFYNDLNFFNFVSINNTHDAKFFNTMTGFNKDILNLFIK